MDITKKSPTVLSLCSGYGGIELGLERELGELNILAHVEIEAFAIENMVAKMEANLMVSAPIWTDVKTLNAGIFRGHVDVLTGGYPCQPFSAAGKRQGEDDPRHLWPHIRKIIRDCQPRCCFFENVEGHITLGLSTVLSDLEEDGYAATWGIFSAEEVGAPHRRKRVFILAHRSGEGLQGSEWEGETRTQRQPDGHATECCNPWPARPGEDQYEWEPPRVVGNTEHDGYTAKSELRSDEKASGERWTEEQEQARESEGASRSSDVQSVQGCTTRSKQSRVVGNTEHDGYDATENSKIECPLGGDTDGTTDRMGHAELYESCDNRTDELRLLGNGVVPATAALAWRTLNRR